MHRLHVIVIFLFLSCSLDDKIKPESENVIDVTNKHISSEKKYLDEETIKQYFLSKSVVENQKRHLTLDPQV